MARGRGSSTACLPRLGGFHPICSAVIDENRPLAIWKARTVDRLEAMSILLQAVEAGSLSGASRRLGIPLATVSRKVSDLEAHLKTRLLSRSSKGLVPTVAGQSFIAASKAILEQLNEAERTAAGEYTAPKGDLVVTAPVVFGRYHVLPVVNGFLKVYPEVGVSLVLSNRSVNLVEEHIDVAVRFGELSDSSLTASRIGSARRVVCASPAYLAEHGTPAAPDELARHAAVTFDGLSATSVWHFQVNGAEIAIPVRSRLSVDTAEGAIDAAAAGMGLTRALSYQVEAQLRRNILALVLTAFELPPWPVQMVYNRRSRLPLKLRAFLDFVKPRLRQRLVDADF